MTTMMNKSIYLSIEFAVIQKCQNLDNQLLVSGELTQNFDL